MYNDGIFERNLFARIAIQSSLDYQDSYQDSLIKQWCFRKKPMPGTINSCDSIPFVLRASNGAHVQYYFVFPCTNAFALYPSIVTSTHPTHSHILWPSNLQGPKRYKVYKITSLSKLPVVDYIFEHRWTWKFYFPTYIYTLISLWTVLKIFL